MKKKLAGLFKKSKGLTGDEKAQTQKEIQELEKKRDEQLATERMQQHLGGVAAAIERWDPQHHPVA